MTAVVHLITGLTGAGKTTYAMQLAEDISAVRMSIDDWMAKLFFMDRNPETDFQWFYDRVQWCCAQMRDTAEEVLGLGKPVVFECGFTNHHERSIFYDWAELLGYPICLHFLDIDSETRWQRVEKRNVERGETFALNVTREMFEFMERIWQAPDASELAKYNGLVID